MRKKLSREEILRNILKYKLQQRRRKTAGETPLKVYRSRRNRCAGCNVLQQRGILSCCNPPLCPDCHKVYNDAPSVRPENRRRGARSTGGGTSSGRLWTPTVSPLRRG